MEVGLILMSYQSHLQPFKTKISTHHGTVHHNQSNLLILKNLSSQSQPYAFLSFSQSQYFAVASLQRMEDEVVVKIGIQGCEEVARRWDDGAHSTVRQIVINHEKCIYSVNIEYDNNGESIWKPKHGGNKGSTSKVVLEYPNEYLISIHGYYSDIGKIMEKRAATPTTVIRSLTLESNTKTYGPFGMEEGTKFSFPIMEAKIVGFHGSSGWFLDAIGIYVQPISQSLQAQHKSEVEVETEIEQFSLGEYGGEGGEPWSECFQAIKQLVIHNDEHWIISIQMEYLDENGNFVWSHKHGGEGGSASQEAVANAEARLSQRQLHAGNLSIAEANIYVQRIDVAAINRMRPSHRSCNCQANAVIAERLRLTILVG
ncbi:jacalin-related lectin 3-like isoform X3 [Benincasa hispida]|uniref:jacalin-related lectin 3-like isoform X3 n=1 Tax=Benincasa hispida TaxID=102211 RepID=UPI0019012B83|nr:jacalin-related lectin 3-like isoform X3 [Benincasa hispida]